MASDLKHPMLHTSNPIPIKDRTHHLEVVSGLSRSAVPTSLYVSDAAVAPDFCTHARLSHQVQINSMPRSGWHEGSCVEANLRPPGAARLCQKSCAHEIKDQRLNPELKITVCLGSGLHRYSLHIMRSRAVFHLRDT